MLDKKGFIDFGSFMQGLVVGLIIGIIIVFLGAKGIIPMPFL